MLRRQSKRLKRAPSAQAAPAAPVTPLQRTHSIQTPTSSLRMLAPDKSSRLNGVGWCKRFPTLARVFCDDDDGPESDETGGYIRMGVIGDGRCFFHSLLATRHPNLPTQYGGQTIINDNDDYAWEYGPDKIYLDLPPKYRRAMADELRDYLAVLVERVFNDITIPGVFAEPAGPVNNITKDEEAEPLQQQLNFKYVQTLLDTRKNLEAVGDYDTADWVAVRQSLEAVFNLLHTSGPPWIKEYCELTRGNIPDAIHFLIYDLYRHDQEVGQEAPAIVYAVFKIPVIFVLAKGDEFQSDMIDCIGIAFDLQNAGPETQICLIAHIGEVHFEPIFRVVTAGPTEAGTAIANFTHSGTSTVIRRIKALCARF